MIDRILKDELRRRGLSARDAAKRCGISHTSILRALRGENIDLTTVKAISRLLDLEPAEILKLEMETGDTLSAEIGIILHQEPKLEEAYRMVIERYHKSEIGMEVVIDVLRYTVIRVQP